MVVVVGGATGEEEEEVAVLERWLNVEVEGRLVVIELAEGRRGWVVVKVVVLCMRTRA